MVKRIDSFFDNFAIQLNTWCGSHGFDSVLDKHRINLLDDENVEVVIPITLHQRYKATLLLAAPIESLSGIDCSDEFLNLAIVRWRSFFSYVYYKENFASVFEYSFADRMKPLGSKDSSCRFCKRGVPNVTFKDDAHALPCSTGNKYLLSNYECDECNSMFGRGIENQYGKWSRNERGLFLIPGRRTVPKLADKRIKISKSGRKIELDGDSELFAVNHDQTEIKVNLPDTEFIVRNNEDQPALNKKTMPV